MFSGTMRGACAITAVIVVLLTATGGSASALTAQWLLNGNVVSSELPATITPLSVLSLRDSKSSLEVLCSYEYEGKFGSGANDLATAVLDLEEKAVNSEKPLDCEEDSGTCTEKLAFLTPQHLPWATEVMKSFFGKIYDLVLNSGAGEPEWDVKCKTSVGEMTDLCQGETGFELFNAASGVEGVYLSENEEITPALTCSLGGAKSGLLGGAMLIATHEGTLSVSEV